nr:hypothetical protein [Pantoea allii]
MHLNLHRFAMLIGGAFQNHQVTAFIRMDGYSNRVSVVADSTPFAAFTAFSVKSHSGSKSAGGNNVLSGTADIYK